MKGFIGWLGMGLKSIAGHGRQIAYAAAAIAAFHFADRASWLYRMCYADTAAGRWGVVFSHLDVAIQKVLPSFYPVDFGFGLLAALATLMLLSVYESDRKKFRHGTEFGSARWGTASDIKPYINPDFRDNVILTRTERLTTESRPRNPKHARNKNCCVIGGSGSGKSRFFVMPNLMQMGKMVSYIVTDPKGSLIVECGKMLKDEGYSIKVFNTINFRKSMRYNPFAYIRSEKDILKLVTVIMENTNPEGANSSDPFWPSAEKLLLAALIGYIWYEAPRRERNFSTLLDFVNASEVHEDDETFQNGVDLLFEELEAMCPDHFAVRQYSQLFNRLCDLADDRFGGRLPYHVRILADEFSNIGRIPNFDKLIATIRSREISVSIILQAKSQLKTMYKDAADTVIGNCDSVLFLGGKEESTLKEISEMLGKETIDYYSRSDNRGRDHSYGTSYQKTGKYLMSKDELAVMDGGKCILQLRGARPFLSDKYDITKHPNYKKLAEYDRRNGFNVESYIRARCTLRKKDVFEWYAY